jgi:hypothetical protein
MPPLPPTRPPSLPRSDLIVLPLLVLLTLAALAGLGEFAARKIFAETGAETCSGIGPAGVAVMRPNCISHRKAAEGPDTVNAYNDCGYRTPQPCGTRPAGGIRVALMGASTAQGLKVQYDATFAAKLSEALTRACHRPVEFQNMGVPGAGLLDIYRRLPEALAMHPDLIMLVLTPYEMKAPLDPPQLAARDAPAAPAPDTAPPPPPEKSLVARLSDLAFNSRILVVAQHYLFQDRATFTKLFLLHGEDADYLRVPYRAGWDNRLRDLDTLLGDMAAHARAAGVPMLLALGPQRIQTSLLDPSVRPPGIDPFEIGHRLAVLAARHGILFQDTLDGFATTPDPDALFYAVDGHMDAAGHAVFARSVLTRLLDSPVFHDCPRRGTGRELMNMESKARGSAPRPRQGLSPWNLGLVLVGGGGRPRRWPAPSSPPPPTRTIEWIAKAPPLLGVQGAKPPGLAVP